ncbi:callose synthase 7-like [Macadamia integrifolia]|uniref:callose synthase 7-like n=1 Tax=Macadamia integrifolia TaxID=60698 RepID=UPI001C4F8897|nr:callose synthase 7-like [Macadamia integrifolia]
MDLMSLGRGVRQFKTYLLHRLEREEMETKPQLAKNDPREIQKFYQMFYEQNIRDSDDRKKPEEMAKIYQIASVLYDVAKTVVPNEKVEEQINDYAREVEMKKKQYVHYNILPLYATGATTGAKPAIMELPEIKASISALCKVETLPNPRALPNEPDNREIAIHDLLDWLWLAFGFQKGNVANQREHLILLLANADSRRREEEEFDQLDNRTVEDLMRKILKNYFSWCNYLHCKQNINIPENAADRQQLQLLYIGLYLLIWGEASNIRFMPECICYIFHNMAKELDGILRSNVHLVSGGTIQPAHQGADAFLREVVTPIYQVLRKEAKRNKGGKARHSKWRNYDDLNEYFWSDKCFKLGWPMDRKADFFVHSDEIHPRNERPNNVTTGKRKPKTNFVEVRTFWHLFRSFDRMWIFFILAFQAMVIVAWSAGGSLYALFDADVFRNVMSIFITYSILNFLQATLDIILSCRAWGSLKFTQIVRYLVKFAAAAVWVVIFPIGYSSSVQNPTGLVRFFSDWISNWKSQSFFNFSVAIYMVPNILAAILFVLPPLRRQLERSNWRIIVLFMWWAQPKLYVGRGMHEDLFSLLRYTLFWILLLISKLAFSYYVEILPLIGPTKLIMGLRVTTYTWHEFFPNVRYNIGVIISMWAPIVLVYFMDAQIWYAIFSTIFGGIHGAFSHLGEIRTLGMLRSRFDAVPEAFTERLVPLQNEEGKKSYLDESLERRNIAKFSQVWNLIINCMREEDLISNRERDLLLVPYSSIVISVVQWPPFLLASKIPIALDMAKDFKGKSDTDLFKKIKNDEYMHSAVIECYEALRDILYGLLEDEEDKLVVKHICDELVTSIKDHRFLNEFRMSELPNLSSKLERLLIQLKADLDNVESSRTQIINVLQDIMEIITEDVMVNGHKIMEKAHGGKKDNDAKEQKFGKINFRLMQNSSWMEKVVRLHLLLTVKESAINVPMNLEARRRITFFANSLLMKMPIAPKVRKMLSFSVLTPYYREDVLYSDDELNKENEDGISILFYLQKIYPDEWSNFLERRNDEKDANAKADLTPQWVSYRGQTLSRTVRGMMYYRQALELQCFLDTAKDTAIFDGYRTVNSNHKEQTPFSAHSQAVADMKFTYVVSCQIYGQQKKSSDARDRSCYQNILNLMLQYPSLRVAYIDEREESVNGKTEKFYYSVLLKGGDKYDEEIYRIKLPGPPTAIGEGKPENQNHAIIFTRGEALQTIDMNQDNYLEEALKMRNVLEEFLKDHHGQRKPTILGLREHIFTGSVSSLAWFMSNQETSFVTIGQRTLANPLRVRFHYGHPDIFDRIFHLTRGGISKASKTINLSEDIFSGFNSTLRGGYVTHHEYIQVGKGRDVGMNQISLFEAKVANGNGEQTLSRDVYRLGRRFDFYRMLSFYFTTVGFYFSSMVTVIIVYVFLYGRLYMVLSGLERSILLNVQQSKSLEAALATPSVYQLGLLLVLPMVMEIGLERGFRRALGDFVIMQLQLASVFFTFHLGTKSHYYGRTILHGGAKYRPTGRGFVVFHAKFADNYRLYSRSHFVKGLELLLLLIVYEVYGKAYRSLNIYWFVTYSIWFLVASWLFAPFIFNPSGFEWQKTVDDWTDWKRWMGNRGGIGIPQDRSWESWWESELEHLKHTDIRGRVLEIILACRFFIYQYGIVYHLNIAQDSKSILVYGLSWLVMATVLLVLKMVSMGRRKFGTDFQLMFRILKLLLFFSFLSVMTVLFVVCGLTIGDLFASILCFMPTGWAILLIGQACRSMMKGIGFWDSMMELARGYEYVMGILIFMPIVILSWFPFVTEFQARLLFNQAFSRGLQISMILAGRKDKAPSSSPS